MSDVSVRRASRAGPSVPARLLAVAGAMLVLLAACALYFRIGWWRMESACSLNDAHGQIHETVSYGWKWQPFGFRCKYDNGETDSSLWF